MNQPACQICGTTQSLLRCAKCKVIYYCSSSHQHTDWPSHKQHCRQLAKQKKEIQNNKLSSNNSWSEAVNVNGTSTGGGQVSLFGTSESEIMNAQAETVSQNQIVSSYNGINERCENSFRIRDENYLTPDLTNPNDRRYEELCKNIIHDMNTYGLSVVDDFLGMEKGLQILNEVHRMYAAGVFKDGQLVSNSIAERDLRTIRGDKITWVKGVEPNCCNIGYLINQIDAVICRANTMHDNGKLGNYKIRERTKAMVACYPGSGSHYVMHVDNPNRDGRVITAIYYLNINWDTKRSGGVLRIFPERGGSVADIEPKFDRLIFFWSDRRNPHEVQPAHRTRYAITVWYFDANEREAALNRFRQFRNTTNST